MLRRYFSSPALFVIVWTSLSSAIYFSLGIVAKNAAGLTPLVFLGAAVFFIVTTMTYVEGASLHQERAGATVFARYAFNELWSFIAGWAVLLDFLILIAVTAFVAVNYLEAFWSPLGKGAPELLIALAIVAYVTLRNVRGFSGSWRDRAAALVALDVVWQLVIIVVGAFLVVDLGALVDSVDLGTSPRWKDLIFALTISTVAFTCLESASGLAGEVKVSRRALRRIVAAATATVIVIYVGVSLVAVAALPVTPGSAPLTGEALDAPMLPVVQTFRPEWVADAFTYITAALAAATLVVAANAAMLGLSRLAYALATNRQIPSAMGRLHPKTGTPYLVIFVGGALAAALVVPRDLDFLVGIYAIGAMLAFLLAHVSICVLRYREPELRRPFKIPFSVRVAGGELPLPSVLGALMAAVAIVSLLVFHEGARYVGLCWMAVGVGLYVTYRRRSEIPLLKRVVVPESALRAEAVDVEYGSILVPILGTPLDDDIVQTAGRLAAAGAEDRAAGAGAIIEALWVFEVPLSLPLDARLPDDQVKGARAALARAKAVGEEYEGVEVATAIVRSRRAGEAIVSEATRRGVEVIVMAAEEPTRIRGGAILGGKSGPRDNFVGEVTKYVVRKSPCRVILTAPPADDADLVSAVPDASH